LLTVRGLMPTVAVAHESQVRDGVDNAVTTQAITSNHSCCGNAHLPSAGRYANVLRSQSRLTPTNLELQLNGSLEGMHSFDSYRSHSIGCHNWGTFGEYTPILCFVANGWGLLRTINVKRQFASLSKSDLFSSFFATLVFFLTCCSIHVQTFINRSVTSLATIYSVSRLLSKAASLWVEIFPVACFG